MLLAASDVERKRLRHVLDLLPAPTGSAIVALLISFENFNTTLMLVGSDPPLTITMYDRMREDSTPVINAVSLFLMLGLISVMAQRDRTAEKSP